MVLQPLLLCVKMERNREMRLSFAVLELGIRVVSVPKSRLGEPLKSLCGLSPFRNRPHSGTVEEEMMIMAGFADPTLMDRLFSVMRQNGLEPPLLKAVLTDFNQHCSCAELYRLLQSEAAALQTRNKKG